MKRKADILDGVCQEIWNREAPGVKPAPSKHRQHFEKFLGTWSKTETAEFDKATSEFERVEEADWR